MSTIDSHVAGIPCVIEYSVHGCYKPARTQADPDDCYEAQYPEVEFTVCDRRGRPAPWLERKLTKANIADIETQILELEEAY